MIKLKNKNWRKVKLGEAININPQVTLKKGVRHPYLDMSGVDPGQRELIISQEKEYKGSGAKFDVGDTVFARITPCLENGKIAQVRKIKKPAFGSTEFFVLRGKEGITDNDFVYYLSLTHYIRKSAEQSMIGVSGRQRVELDAFKNIEVSIPQDLSEQKRIASILSAFDDKIELNNKVNQTLEQMAQVIFREWFVKFRFPGWEKVKMIDSELGKIPKGWEVGTLGKIMNLRKERIKKFDDWKDLKLIDIGRMPRKSLSITSYGKGKEIKTSVLAFKKGDILFGAVRPYFHKVIIAPLDGITNSSVFVIYPKEKIFYRFLTTVLFCNHTISYASKCASGTKMPVLKWGDLCNMPIVIPPQDIFGLFESKARSFYNTILNNVEENQKLSSLRDLLLPKLMSGEIRV